MLFVDDDPTKQGREIHGIRVSGLCDKIPEVVARHEIELILIALPSATSKQIQRIVELCEKTGKPFRILPRLQDLVSGQASIRDLRDVRIEDLLGRESVSLDWTSITRGVQGKTILVTGGGGSIGTELCRQVARLKPAHLVIFEQSEFNLYSIELELRQTFPDLRLTVLLGDIYDAVAVEQMLRAYRPTVILHAAAYKHVPMLEHQLRAAVKNNALGTRTLGSLAERHGCATFVMISTDKAVNPANIMGMTKRVAEIFCQNLSARSSTHFITVRFGNVLGSAGSVIPLFQKQIAAGGPVMVTHPEITRYFMTIPEAAQLILQAGTMGRGGEIFVLDMGEPVKIAYLAEQLIHLSGKNQARILKSSTLACVRVKSSTKSCFMNLKILPERHTRKSFWPTVAVWILRSLSRHSISWLQPAKPMMSGRFMEFCLSWCQSISHACHLIWGLAVAKVLWLCRSRIQIVHRKIAVENL